MEQKQFYLDIIIINFALTLILCASLGLSSDYQATSSSGVQAGISDLPQLTGEDLKMLDAFDQIRPREGNGSLPPQPQQPSTTLNYHGNRVLM